MRFNNRRLIFSLVLLVVLGFGIGTIIIFSSPSIVSNSVFNPSQLGGKEVREATIELGNKTKITIINSVGDLNVEIVDGDEVTVVYEAYEKSILEINESSKSVKIEGKISARSSISNINSTNIPVALTVNIPRDFTEHLEIKSGVGETELKLGSYSKLDADLGVGEMEIYLESLEQGEIIAEVGVGSLQFNLPEGSDVELKANTGVGGISNRANFDTKESKTAFVTQSFNGVTGEGNAKVTLKVGTGEITIR